MIPLEGLGLYFFQKEHVSLLLSDTGSLRKINVFKLRLKTKVPAAEKLQSKAVHICKGNCIVWVVPKPMLKWICVAQSPNTRIDVSSASENEILNQSIFKTNRSFH